MESVNPPGLELTALEWTVEPDGLVEVLRDAATVAGLPLHVDENGAAFDDPPVVAGSVRDDPRTRFVADHVAAAMEARAGGIDVRSYFVWSLLDNFEWAEGYEPRFGIVHVDYDTQARTPKASALWYRDHIAEIRGSRSGT